MTKKFALLLILSLMVAMGQAQMRDPTQPPMMAKQTEGVEGNAFTLSSIVIGAGRRFAVINDQFVSVGERIAGAKVVSIKANRVTLLIGGRVLKLYLIGNEVRKGEF